MEWYTYILKCADGTFYTGMTNDLEKRLSNHNKGTAAKYTRCRLPVELVWHTQCESRSEALKKESEIKKLTRKQKLKLIEEKKNG